MEPCLNLEKYFSENEFRQCLEAVVEFSQGTEVCLAGGAVRNMLLGREITDLDFSVSESISIEQMAENIAAQVFGKCFQLNSRFLSWRIILPSGRTLDLTSRMGKTIKEDCLRRDLSINSVALLLEHSHLLNSTIFDPARGLEDIHHGLLRMPRPGVFDEDPVRAVRLYRFISMTGFEVDPDTRKAAIAAARSLDTVPSERIGEETLKLLRLPSSIEGLKAASDDEVLFQVFPSLKASKGCAQNTFHHLPVLDHSLECLYQLENIISSPETFFSSEGYEVLESSSDPDYPAGLKLASLLHDIGKPVSKAAAENGRITFYRHESIGAQMAAKDCAALRLPRTLCRYISSMVELHMRLASLAEGFLRKEITPKATARFLRQAQEIWKDLGIIAMADTLATRGPDADPQSPAHIRIYLNHLMQLERERRGIDSRGKPPIDGNIIMKTFGLPPGPAIGLALNAVLEAFLVSPGLTTTEALEIAEKAIKEQF